MQTQLRTDHDDRTARVVDAFAEQVLPEAPLLATKEVGERTERTIGAGMRDRVPAAAVVDQRIDRFLDRGPNGDAIMNTGAALPKKNMEAYMDLTATMPSRRFNLYAMGYDVSVLKAYNLSRGNPVTLVRPVEPRAMPAEYKKHAWLVYTASAEINTVGWPMAIAEAQASGVGVLMQEIRPDLRAWVGPAGYLFRTIEEAAAIVSRPFPAERRQACALDDLCGRIVGSHPSQLIRLRMPRLLVKLDPDGLERALNNLIDNALEYGAPPVQLSGVRQGNQVLLRVDDHGAGIATDTLLTMPSPSRSNDRQRQRHRGLGLAIVERFCLDHQGRLALLEAPSGGLRAELRLPVLLRAQGQS